MNATPDPVPWSQLLLVAWPLWLALAVALVVGNLDRVCAVVAYLARRRA